MIDNSKNTLVSESVVVRPKYVFHFEFNKDEYSIDIGLSYRIAELIVQRVNDPGYMKKFFISNPECATPYYRYAHYDDDSKIVALDVVQTSRRNTYTIIIEFKIDESLPEEDLGIFCTMFRKILSECVEEKNTIDKAFNLSQVTKHEQTVTNKEFMVYNNKVPN